MGPLTPQQYDIPLKCVQEIQTDVFNCTNDYQFKVMLLGDSGVGKCEFHLFSSSQSSSQVKHVYLSPTPPMLSQESISQLFSITIPLTLWLMASQLISVYGIPQVKKIMIV